MLAHPPTTRLCILRRACYNGIPRYSSSSLLWDKALTDVVCKIQDLHFLHQHLSYLDCLRAKRDTDTSTPVGSGCRAYAITR